MPIISIFFYNIIIIQLIRESNRTLLTNPVLKKFCILKSSHRTYPNPDQDEKNQ